MNDWAGGYITDVSYLMGYHPEQSPGHMALAALLNGVATELINTPENLSYLELGCGLGFGATLLGACNPSWRVTAIDFNPAHIAAARLFAAEAGVGNVTFLEADLATLAEADLASAIPEADVASLHGVWSWVSERVRAGMLRLLSAKVRAGGLVHVSYNALPAWQYGLGMQRLLREAGRKLANRSDRQATAGLDVVRALAEAKAEHLASPLVKQLMKRLENAVPGYLAHEFMNENWQPCFHADVATAFAMAKFDWVGSARLYENFPDLVLTPEQRKLAARFEDPELFELIKDLSGGPALRHDIYVRGARRLSESERNAAISDITLALATQPGAFRYEWEMPAGKATLNRDFYGAVVDALCAGPRRIGALLDLPGIERGHLNPSEVAAMLVGTGQAVVALRPQAGRDARHDRILSASARRAARFDKFDRPIALASHRLGAGLIVPALELLILSRLATEGATEPLAWAQMLAPHLEPDKQEALGQEIARILDERTQIWRLCGVV